MPQRPRGRRAVAPGHFAHPLAALRQRARAELEQLVVEFEPRAEDAVAVQADVLAEAFRF